jgi:hypothetical protein
LVCAIQSDKLAHRLITMNAAGFYTTLAFGFAGLIGIMSCILSFFLCLAIFSDK